jgi:predicted DNA-binding protein
MSPHASSNILSSMFGVESKPSQRHGEYDMTTATAAAKKPASIRLSARLNSALNEQAKQLKISRDTLVRRALVNMLEEIEDLKTIEARRGEKSVPWERVKAELGL